MNLPNTIEYGPTTQLSEEIDAIKYRADGETFNMKVARIAHALKDDENHRVNFKDAIKHQGSYQPVEFKMLRVHLARQQLSIVSYHLLLKMT